MTRQPLSKLYIQVPIGIALGALIDAAFSGVAVALQPFVDAFMKLIEMLFAQIIFGTFVLVIGPVVNVMKPAGPANTHRYRPIIRKEHCHAHH